MGSTKYNVIFRGEIAEGADPGAVKQGIARLFRTDAGKVDRLFSGKPFIVKKAAALDTCRKVADRFEQAGAVCEIKRADTGTAQSNQAESAAGQRAGETDPSPVRTVAYTRVSPPGPAADGTAGGRGERAFAEPQRMPAASGVKWIRDAIHLFRRNPVAWIGATVLLFVINFVVQLIPFVGALAMNILNPVFGAGFVIGSSEQDHGRAFSIEHLFAGFYHNFGELVIFSIVFVFALFIVMGVFAVAGVLLIAGAAGGISAFMNPQLLTGMPSMILVLFALVLVLLMVPLAMIYWFSPALIVLDDIPVFKAMKASFKACLFNVVPFLVYGLLFLIIAGVFLGALGAAVLLTAASPLVTGITGFFLACVFLLLIPPIAIASVYTSYRDIFAVTD